MEVICPSCNKPAEWIDNAEVYGRRYGKSYMCWYCRACDYMVGCHENTKRPLGTMVGKELRQLRRAVHAKIDPLYKSGKIRRKHIYARISKALGYTYHTGEADEEACKKVLALDIENLLERERENLREYAKDRKVKRRAGSYPDKDTDKHLQTYWRGHDRALDDLLDFLNSSEK